MARSCWCGALLAGGEVVSADAGVHCGAAVRWALRRWPWRRAMWYTEVILTVDVRPVGGIISDFQITPQV